MASDLMREKFNYTQRPANPRLFLAAEIANALDITTPTFWGIVNKLDLDFEKIPDGRGHNVAYFTHDALGRCREELERRAAARKCAAPKLDAAAEAEAHPLVKDPRFLKLSYFPDIVPACYAEED